MKKTIITFLLAGSGLVAGCQGKPEQHSNYGKVDTEKYNTMTPQDIGNMAKHLGEEFGAVKADSVSRSKPQPK